MPAKLFEAASAANSKAMVMILKTLIYKLNRVAVAIGPADRLEIGKTNDQEQRYDGQGRKHIEDRDLLIRDQSSDNARHKQHRQQGEGPATGFLFIICH